MTAQLTPLNIIEMIKAATANLERYRDEINSLNVFPVPDGDTGTNMLLTMKSVLEEIYSLKKYEMNNVCEAIAHGSLMGARGNSGVVLSQILKGFCAECEKGQSIGVKEFANALVNGSKVAYKAVMKPVEGTILTVVREASDFGSKICSNYNEIESWLAGVIDEARRSLSSTPDLLGVLKEAGVVDAGGRGLVVILEGFLAGLKGDLTFEAPKEGTSFEMTESLETDDNYRYEVQYILKCKENKAGRLKNKLNLLGGSLLVVGDDKTYRVHIHTDDLGKVIEESSALGPLYNVEISDLHEQRRDAASVKDQEKEKGLSVVAVAVGDGIKQTLESMGVDVIVDGGQSMNPSTGEILVAVESAKSDNVIIIPNNRNIIPSAEQVKNLTRKMVDVIPSTSIVEGFASMIEYEPTKGYFENVSRMREAVGSAETGAVTIAVRSSSQNGISMEKGDFIGIFNGQIQSTGNEFKSVALNLLEKMISKEPEIVTLISGCEADISCVEDIEATMNERHPEIEYELINGLQPVYHLIIGIS